MFKHDAAHTGIADEVVKPPLEVLWKYKFGNQIRSSPTVSGGVVYIGDTDNTGVYAFDARTGSLKWNYETGDVYFSSPAVSDGVVYMSGSNVIALDANTGGLKWDYSRTDRDIQSPPYFSSPAVSDGVVYVGSNNGYVYALDASTGSLIWKYKTGGAIYYSSPAVAGGVVYIGSMDNSIYALDIGTGSLKWRYNIGGTVDSSPAVSGDTVYVGSGDNHVYALNAATGALLWKYETGGAVRSSPAISNGMVYIGSKDDYVYALDADTGDLRWKYLTNGDLVSSPAVSGDVVYIGSNDNYLYALNASTGSLIWNYETLGAIESSPAISGAIVYVGSNDRYLYAFASAKKVLSAVTTIPAITTPTFTTISTSPTSTVTISPRSESESNWGLMMEVMAIFAFISVGIIALRTWRPKKGIKSRRTVYDPVAGNLISDKKLDYPEVKKWIISHPPLDYWYILRLDNLESTVEQWAVELDTHIALSVKEAYIDGFERSLKLNKEHMQWKDKYVLRVPKELGIPLPPNGTRRLYFRLNIDCTTALLPRYSISGKVIANGVRSIPEKDFPYSCELRKLKEVWIKKPKEVEKYAESKAEELYSLDAARAIADALRLYNESSKLIERGYVEENKLRRSIKNLRASLENVKALTGAERPLRMIDESFAVMETVSVELALKRWKEMNLFDVMMTELLKGRG